MSQAASARGLDLSTREPRAAAFTAGSPDRFEPGTGVLLGYRAPVLHDLDGDGKLDLIAGGRESFAFLRGQGDGTFDAPVVHSIGPGANALSPVVSDLDQDGNDDVGMLRQSRDSLVIFPGDGAGGFGTPVSPTSWPRARFRDWSAYC